MSHLFTLRHLFIFNTRSVITSNVAANDLFTNQVTVAARNSKSNSPWSQETATGPYRQPSNLKFAAWNVIFV